MLNVVQLRHSRQGRRVAIVAEPQLRLLEPGLESVYHAAMSALKSGKTLAQTLEGASTRESLSYDEVYNGLSEWKLLPPFDHPDSPGHCLVTGTGLTHKASAESRQAMHAGQEPLTDSMRMYQAGLAGGKPGPGKIGIAPEWFYKGCGTILRAPGDALEVPAFGLDGGDEAEVAGVYVVDGQGAPRRVGLALANEFSDHKLERQSYLYLAPSKLRTCALGPELRLGGDFREARGATRIIRAGKVLWSHPFATGEANMSHSLANLEHHHFKYGAHRRPGDAHIHFFGADFFSFSDGIELQDGDIIELELAGFGRPLRNPVRIDRTPEQPVTVLPL